MTDLAIQVPHHARGNCKSCHAGLIWAQTERGKWTCPDGLIHRRRR